MGIIDSLIKKFLKSIPSENQFVIDTVKGMKDDNLFEHFSVGTHLYDIDWLLEEVIEFLEKATGVKEALENQHEEHYACMCMVNILTDRLLYKHDFTYKGVPGFKSTNDITVYKNIIKYLRHKNHIRHDEYVKHIDDLHATIANIG